VFRGLTPSASWAKGCIYTELLRRLSIKIAGGFYFFSSSTGAAGCSSPAGAVTGSVAAGLNPSGACAAGRFTELGMTVLEAGEL